MKRETHYSLSSKTFNLRDRFYPGNKGVLIHVYQLNIS